MNLSDLASHWLRRLDEDEGCLMLSHWEGCEQEHMRCAIRRFAEGVEALTSPLGSGRGSLTWTSPHGASITEPIP